MVISSEDSLSAPLLALMIALGAVAWAVRGDHPAAARTAWIGFALHLFGAYLRYQVLFALYGGVGDATSYYESGLFNADALGSLDFDALTRKRAWWGTVFVEWVAGVVLLVVGRSLTAAYVMFSLFAFLGLYWVGRAFESEFGGDLRYRTWLLCWPSLAFWPSSLGKESLIILSLGLVAWGFQGRGGRSEWGRVGAGLFLTFCVRPHFAAMLVTGLMSAHLLHRGRGSPLGTVAFAIAAALLVTQAADQLGLEDPLDLEAMGEFAETWQTRSAKGGGAIEPPSGVLAPIQATVNVLLRPFPWEVHNGMAAVASLENCVLAIMMYQRRSRLRLALTKMRSHRLLAFAGSSSLLIVLALGLTFGNLGIIARERIVVLPLLFMLMFLPELGAKLDASRHPESPSYRVP